MQELITEATLYMQNLKYETELEELFGVLKQLYLALDMYIIKVNIIEQIYDKKRSQLNKDMYSLTKVWQTSKKDLARLFSTLE